MRALILAALPLALFAQLGADRAATNRVYQTDEVVNEAWMRHIVTEYAREDGPPELRDRMGKFMSAANLAALGVASENASRVAEAWMQGFALGTQQLAQAMLQAPSTGVWMKLCHPLEPSFTRRSVDIFVVSNGYDSARNRDEFLVYVSRDLPMTPVMQVPYISESGLTTNVVKGRVTVSDVPHSSWTNTVTVNRFGCTYRDCHRVWFTRPPSLKDVPVFLHRHGVFGSRASGFEWGSVAVTVTLPGEEAELAYTGSVTNLEERLVSRWSNGALVGTVELEEEPAGDTQ